MKKARKLMAFLLAAVMVMGMTMSVSAANTNPHTITIDNSTSGYTYEAYQVFAGDYSEEEGVGKLSNITWGEGVDGDALLTELKNLDVSGDTPFAECATAEAVAEVLGAEGNKEPNSEVAKAFAEVVAKHLNTKAADFTYVDEETGYTATVTGDGYYFVKNASVPDDGTYTRYLLAVVDDVNIAHKGTTPTVEKEIEKVNEDAVENTHAEAVVGDTISFSITGTLSDEYDNYKSYYYHFVDTMSAGLTYNDNAKVYIVNGQNKEEVTNQFIIEQNVDGVTLSAKANLKELTGVTITSATQVVVEYTATVNESAVTGSTGNTNSVVLKYENDPYHEGDGNPSTPDEPNDPDEPGTTPPEVNIIYSFEVGVNKEDETGTALPGAGFTLSKKTGTDPVVWTPVGSEITGETTFTWNLTSGTYKIEETTVPEGYNKADDIIFKIVPTYNNSDPAALTELAIQDENGAVISEFTVNLGAGTASIDIENRAGSLLPSTGGMGTTIFYIVGGVLVLVAVVLLVTRKRMKKEEV